MQTYWLKEQSVEAEPFDYSQEMMDKYGIYYTDNYDDKVRATYNVRNGSVRIILITRNTNKFKYWVVKHQNGNIELLNDDTFQEKYQRKSSYLKEENDKPKKDNSFDSFLAESFSERCASIAMLILLTSAAVVAVLAAWACIFK